MWPVLLLLFAAGLVRAIPPDDTYGMWGWVSGTSLPNAPSVYVTSGDLTRYDAANSPGARAKPAYYRYHAFPTGFQLFAYGGYGYDTAGTLGLLNDLIAYDPGLGQWAHLSGNDPASGTADVLPSILPLAPGGRMGAGLAYNEHTDELYLFGGTGFSCSSPDYLACTPNLHNSMMKTPRTPIAWSYVSGSVMPNAAPPSGLPTARAGAVACSFPASVNWGIYIFGGYGLQAGTGLGPMATNDLWMYFPIGNAWYTSGVGATALSTGTAYDTYSVLAVPGSRYDYSVYLNPATGTQFFYGGTYITGTHWADLWEYDPSIGPFIPSTFINTGLWRQRAPAAPSPVPGVPGSPGLLPYATTYPLGTYGTQVPPERFFAPIAVDPTSSSLYMFGGMHGSFGSPTYLGGFWQFDLGADLWRRLEGDVAPGPAVYGPLGVHAEGYHPGGEVGIAGYLSDPGGSSPDELFVFFGYRNPYSNDDWSYLVPPFLCYGVPPNSSVCSGHGECVAEDDCVCSGGYVAGDCSVYFECYGKNLTDPTICSNHGDCIAQDDCDCDAGYSGPECGEWLCTGFPNAHPNVCSGHGVCVDIDTCVCEPLYSGPDCEDWDCCGVHHASPGTCYGNGFCIAHDTCGCTGGWSGPCCNATACFGVPWMDALACSGNGVCTGPDTCVCDAPYYGSNCALWDCYGVASSEPDVCNTHGVCVGPDDCDCYAGYSGATYMIHLFGGTVGVPTVSTSAHSLWPYATPVPVVAPDIYVVGVDPSLGWRLRPAVPVVGFNRVVNLMSGATAADLKAADTWAVGFLGFASLEGNGYGYNGGPMLKRVGTDCLAVDWAGTMLHNFGTLATCDGVVFVQDVYSTTIYARTAGAPLVAQVPQTGLLTPAFDGNYGFEYPSSIPFGIFVSLKKDLAAFFRNITLSSVVEFFDTDDVDSDEGGICSNWFCDGLQHTDGSVCSGHGTCIAPETCACDHGYYETYCSNWGCPGLPCVQVGDCETVPHADPGTCFGNGVCVSPYVCSCDPQAGPVWVSSFWGNDCGTCQGKTPTLYWDDIGSNLLQTWDGDSDWYHSPHTVDDLYTPLLVWNQASHTLTSILGGTATVGTTAAFNPVFGPHVHDERQWTVGAKVDHVTITEFTAPPTSANIGHLRFLVAERWFDVVITTIANAALTTVHVSMKFVPSLSGCTPPTGVVLMVADYDPSNPDSSSIIGELEAVLNNFWFMAASYGVNGDTRQDIYVNGELDIVCVQSGSTRLGSLTIPLQPVEVEVETSSVTNIGEAQMHYFYAANRTYGIQEVIDAESAMVSTGGMLLAPYTCYGKPCSEDCVCSGNGLCLWQDHCACFENYIGDECETLDIHSCFGYEANDNRTCSAHGDCTAHDVCECDIGYEGHDCSQYIECDRDCGSHGYCIEDHQFWAHGLERCDCDEGWSGRWCQQYVNCNLTYGIDDTCFHWLPTVAYPLREGAGETYTSVYWRNIAPPPPPDIDNLGVGPYGVYINAPPTGGGVFDLVTISTTPGDRFGVSFWVSGVAWGCGMSGHFTFGGSLGVGTDVRYWNSPCEGLRIEVGNAVYVVGPHTPVPVNVIIAGFVGSPQAQVYVNGLLVAPAAPPAAPILVAGGILSITDINAIYNVTNVAYWQIPFEAASVAAVYSAGPNAHIFDALYTLGTSPTCFGLLCDDPSVCNGRGACVANDVCECCPGFQGELGQCEEFAEGCPACLNCTLECGDHGQCATRPDYAEVCDCSDGWGGEFCDIPPCPDGCANGTCVPGGCLCDEGWFTKNCSVRECANGTIFDEALWACRLPVCFGLRADQTGVCGWRYVRPCIECMSGCVGGFSRGRCVDDDVCLCFCAWKGEDCSVAMDYVELAECMPES